MNHTNYYYQNYQLKKKYDYIYHLSDIHIYLNSRHKEYQEVFETLYTQLKSFPELDKSIIVITGDILHSKTELLPECIEITRMFLTSLSEIATTVIMAGNHDLNVNNQDRMDGLTPIVNGIPDSKPLFYIKDTGVYKFGNILFSLSSVRDYTIIPPQLIKCEDGDELKICLFHGRVNGALLFNGTTIEGEITKHNKKTITPSNFANYDLALLGDIHKFQYLNKNKTMAYAGSLIQQNHGETIQGHGFIRWNLETKESQFYEVKNNYSFHTININQGKIENPSPEKVIEASLGCYLKWHQENYSPNLFLRIYYTKTPNEQLQELISHFKRHHTILGLTFFNQDECSDQQSSKIGSIAHNITNISNQNNLIEEYLRINTDLPDITIQQIKELNAVSNENITIDKFKNSNQWKLINLEFSNLFSYGEHNKIDFTNLNGIVGIIAPNHTGKSALLDIIIFTLFDKFPRKGSIKDIINNRRRSFYTKLTFRIGEWNYIIEKNGKLSNKNSLSSKANFYRINDNQTIKEVLVEDSITKTKHAVLNYIGQYDDIIQTTISLQNNNCNFIDGDNTTRKKELERILKISFVDDLTKNASSIYNEKKAVFNHLQNKDLQDNILKLVQDSKDLGMQIKELKNRNRQLEQEWQSLQNKKELLNKELIPDVESKLKTLRKKIDVPRIGYHKKKTISDILLDKKDKIKNLKIKLEKSMKYHSKVIIKYKLMNEKEISSEEREITKNHQLWIQNQKNKIQDLEDKIDILYNKKLNSSIVIMNANKESTHNKFMTKQEQVQKNKVIIEQKQQEIIQLQLIVDKRIQINQNIETIQKTINSFQKEELPQQLNDFVDDRPRYLLEEELKLYASQLQGSNPKINGLNLECQLENDDIVDNDDFDKWKLVYGELWLFNYLEEFQENNFKREEEKNNSFIKLNDLRQELKEIAQTEKNIKELNKNIARIESENKDIENWIKNYHLALKNCLTDNELNKLKEEKKLINNQEDIQYETHHKNKKIIDDWRTYDSKLKDLQSSVDKIENYQSEIELLEKQEIKNNNKLENIEQIGNKILTITRRLEDIQTKIKIKEQIIFKNKGLLETMKTNLEELKVIEKEMSLYKHYIASLKQIPYIMINKIVPVLQNKINSLLSIVTDFMVVIKIDNNHIDIYLDRPILKGELVLLNNASGFERFISSLAIRIALLDISQLPKCNFMAIDEGWTSFDYNNINKVKQIFDFLKTKFDFILSISHLSAIREHCQYQINLKKNKDGFTKICY